MERRNDFRKRHISLAQEFAGSDRIDRVAIHVTFEQILRVPRQRIVEEVTKFRLRQTPPVAEMKNVELVPVPYYFWKMLEHQGEDWPERLELLVP
jgi:hypothetical protein